MLDFVIWVSELGNWWRAVESFEARVLKHRSLILVGASLFPLQHFCRFAIGVLGSNYADRVFPLLSIPFLNL